MTGEEALEEWRKEELKKQRSGFMKQVDESFEIQAKSSITWHPWSPLVTWNGFKVVAHLYEGEHYGSD